MCLRRGCDSASQCYNIQDAAVTISSAYTLRIVTYLWIPGSNTLLDKTAVESVMGEWLDIAAGYVSLLSQQKSKSILSYTKFVYRCRVCKELPVRSAAV